MAGFTDSAGIAFHFGREEAEGAAAAGQPGPAHAAKRHAPSPARVLRFTYEEAVARAQDVGPLDLLLGLLRDAEDPVETELVPQEQRRRAMLGLPNRGPSPVRQLVEAQGLTLDRLRAAVVGRLDRGR